MKNRSHLYLKIKQAIAFCLKIKLVPLRPSNGVNKDMADNVRYKQAQIINFFASKDSGNQITKMKLYKLVWLADKLHLLQHGDFFSGDKYCAMEFGIVPSAIRDLTNKPNILGLLTTDGNYTLTSISDVDITVFGETELDIMNKVWSVFGDREDFFLSDLSHEYPEYLRYEKDIKSKGGSYRVVIEDFFNIPEKNGKNMSDFFDFDSEYLQFMLEDYLERRKIMDAWEEHHVYTNKKYLQSMN